MKMLAAALLAGAVLTGSLPAHGQAPAPQSAQSEAAPPRVVIAPARTDLARIVKAGLAARYAAVPRGTPAYEDAQKLYYFYGERHFEPVWLSTDTRGGVALSDRALAIRALFEEAHLDGLRPEDYLDPAIDPASAGNDPERLAAVETAFSAAVVRYARHAASGRIDPRAISTLIEAPTHGIAGTDLLVELAGSDAPAAMLAALHPTHPEYLGLKAALGRFFDGTAQVQVRVPDGTVLRTGMSDPRVPLLRERLGVAAPASGGTAYDQVLADAVSAFQTSLGLIVDGVLGPATVAALNGGAGTSKADILANMERWRWAPRDLGEFRVEVNIPEFRLAIRRGEQTTYATRIVVGTKANQTPVFSDAIRHIVVNPYWNVPTSIANGEILPALRRNPNYLAGQNMELLSGGQVVNASGVDWSQVQRLPYRVRQRPGPGNALGTVKFLFPNQHDVYLHDTPSKHLFARSSRAFSHGCVRVENPMEFADALLANEPSLSRASLEAMYGPSERWVNPTTPVPVHLFYFTLRVDEDGSIRSYGDIYGHNDRLIELLGV